MALPELGDSGVYVVADTVMCDGTGGLLALLKGFKKKVTVLADPGLYSHFNAILKRCGVAINYWELDANQEIGDLPLTENPPVTWLDAPKRVKISKILENLSKSQNEVIAIPDILTIFLELGASKTVDLLFELKSLCQALVIKANESILKELWPIDQLSTAGLYFSPLASGVSSEYLGKVRVEYTQGLVKSEIGVFYYKISADNFVLVE